MPELTDELIHLLRQLSERDRQVLDGRPRPRGIARLVALGYVHVHTLNVADLLYSITATGRAVLVAIDGKAAGNPTRRAS